MTLDIKPDEALRLMHEVSLGLVRGKSPGVMPDFTVRQLAILFTIYLEAPPHTVRGLAGRLGVGKPVVTRALTSMGKQGMVARMRDEKDKRNVVIHRTPKGSSTVATLANMVHAKARELGV